MTQKTRKSFDEQKPTPDKKLHITGKSNDTQTHNKKQHIPETHIHMKPIPAKQPPRKRQKRNPTSTSLFPPPQTLPRSIKKLDIEKILANASKPSKLKILPEERRVQQIMDKPRPNSKMTENQINKRYANVTKALKDTFAHNKN